MSVANILSNREIDRVKNIVIAFQYQYPIVPVSICLELFVLEVIIFMLTQVISFCYAFGTAIAIGIFLN